MVAMILALVPLGRTLAFEQTIVIALYMILFATGILLFTARLPSAYRAFWTIGLSVGLVVMATTINGLMAPGDEGGPILALIVFGFYLGLPTLILALLFGLAFGSRVPR